MKAEEVHAKLYKEALENLDKTEEVFYYLCPVWEILKISTGKMQYLWYSR